MFTYFRPTSTAWRLSLGSTSMLYPAARKAGSRSSKWIGDIWGQRIVWVLRISFVNGTFSMEAGRMVALCFFCSRTRMAASRERTRIRAAPRLLTSSIFRSCINLIGTGQNVGYLVRGDGVQTAAERVQLDQIQVFCCLYIVCCCVQTGMIHPLVHNI